MKTTHLLQLALLTSVLPLFCEQDLAAIPKRPPMPKFVEYLFTPLGKKLRSVTVPDAYAFSGYSPDNKLVLNPHQAFDSSSIPGYSTDVSTSDKLLVADASSARNLPKSLCGESTCAVFCDVYNAPNQPYLGDPRTFCKDALRKLEEKTGAQLLVGVEIEFFLVDLEAFNNGSLIPVDNKQYFDSESTRKIQKLKHLMVNSLRESGVNVEKWHHEVAEGQFEMSLKYGNPVEIADQLMLTRHIIQLIAHDNDLHAIFMPKPFANRNGNGLHMHFSLWNDTEKCNAFCGEGNEQFSDLARSFLAGVMNHISELDLLFNSTVNSFKRLVSGFEAPVYIEYGNRNRSAVIRIPDAFGVKAGARYELRCADLECNPYIAFGALALAGLDGIKSNATPKAECSVNLFKLSDAELADQNIERLPGSLGEAIDLFENSKFVKEALPEVLRSEYLGLKKAELHSFNTATTDWEISQYA